MDDDEQFKIAYGTDLEITDPIVKLRIDQSGQVCIGKAEPSEKLQIEGGSLFVNGENTGVIVDAGSKRVGFMKYPNKEGGIWRVSSQDFEIGRVNVNVLPDNPTAFTTDLYIAGNGNIKMTGPLEITAQGTALSVTYNGAFGGNLSVSKWVGVGTTNPQASLHIQDKNYGNIKLFSQSGGIGRFYI